MNRKYPPASLSDLYNKNPETVPVKDLEDEEDEEDLTSRANRKFSPFSRASPDSSGSGRRSFGGKSPTPRDVSPSSQSASRGEDRQRRASEEPCALMLGRRASGPTAAGPVIWTGAGAGTMSVSFSEATNRWKIWFDVLESEGVWQPHNDGKGVCVYYCLWRAWSFWLTVHFVFCFLGDAHPTTRRARCNSSGGIQ